MLLSFASANNNWINKLIKKRRREKKSEKLRVRYAANTAEQQIDCKVHKEKNSRSIKSSLEEL